MKKLLLTALILAAAYVPAGAALAATAADACYAVPQNYNGQAVCESAYTTCIANRPGDASGCQSNAQQIGQSTYSVGVCQAQNANANCTPVPQSAIDFINTPKPLAAPTSAAANSSSKPGIANPDGSLPYVPLEPLPGLDQSGTSNFAGLVNTLFTLLISIGGLVAVAALVVGGITYMVSDVVDRKSESKSRMYAAVWGLVLLLASYLILNTINPQLVNFGNFSQDLGSVPDARNAPARAGSGSGNSVTQADIQDCEDTGKTLYATPTGYVCK